MFTYASNTIKIAITFIKKISSSIYDYNIFVIIKRYEFIYSCNDTYIGYYKNKIGHSINILEFFLLYYML